MENKPDLERVLAYYDVNTSRLKPRGWTDVRCPVHSEKRASCGVNLELGKIRCQGCDFHGDSIDLIQRMENLGTVGEALAFAKDKFGYQGSGVREAARPSRYKFEWEEGGY